MKKTILLIAIILIYCNVFSQYIGVRARYVDTRLVDNSPHAPSREDRLVLSFFYVDDFGNYTPASLSNYDVWIYKGGEVYGQGCGYIFDSCGNNYAGYTYTAPKTIAYYNSYQSNYVGCYPGLTTQYTLNGHELDCGFIPVSYWETDDNTGEEAERFTAPNVCLPYYIYPNLYAQVPGNLNFLGDQFPMAPLNWYNYSCGGPEQLIIRGVIPSDATATFIPLPIQFANEHVSVVGDCHIQLAWSNLTESDIHYYVAERSVNGNSFTPIGYLFPYLNNGDAAHYTFIDSTIPAHGTFIYRIKAVENDSSFFYSLLMRVNSCNQPSSSLLSVFPNPAINGTFTYEVTNLPRSRYAVSLINTTGQEMIHKEINHTGGLLSDMIRLAYAPGGIYTLLIRSDNTIFSTQILIKH